MNADLFFERCNSENNPKDNNALEVMKNDTYEEIKMETYTNFEQIKQAFKPIQFYKGSSYIKVKNIIENKINMKILDEFGSPVYLRQLTANSPDQIFIDISNWYIGVYRVVFSSSTGEKVSDGVFEIN